MGSLTPNMFQNKSLIQKKVFGTKYSKPDSKKKSLMQDHISDLYYIKLEMWTCLKFCILRVISFVLQLVVLRKLIHVVISDMTGR